MNTTVFEAINITKKYRNTLALNQVSMSVMQGDIYGFIGENGAGKTTMIRLLTGLAEPTTGNIALFGKSDKKLAKQRERIGCIIESPSLYLDMTAHENLEVQRLQRGIPGKVCIDNALELVNLRDAGKKKAKDFSLGMRQRLALAIALLGNPEFLVLDEPINGLDPTGIIELRNLLKRLNEERGITILISSHILSELHQLANRYGILHEGKLLQEITAAELEQRCKKHLLLQVNDVATTSALLESELNTSNFSVMPDKSIHLYDYVENAGKVSALLSANNIIIYQLAQSGDSLETYYTNLIGGCKMINHFKAEFYKLFRSKIMIAILGVCVALVMVSFALGDMTFFGAGDGTESVIGFQAKCYLSSEMPTFQTVARSSLAYTAFFWIVCLVFATIFFTKEYNTGTIKLSVAYGTKRTILYYTKAITILAVSLITYLIFVAAFFVIEIIQSGYIPSASEALTLFGWALACGIVLLAFESISIFLCVIIQNIGVVTGICCLYVFSGASVYLMLWSNMDAASIPLKIFVYGNPMYYWMNFCSCRTMGIIEHLPFISWGAFCF